MAKRKRKTKSPEELSTENELMKLKMMAQFGGNFVGTEAIPPEIENQFLKQIFSYHQQHDPAKKTTVYKFIGSPEYNLVTDLNDKEVKAELNKLTKLMLKKGVALSVLAENNARVIYRFITEELFKMEIEDVHVKGWINQFIYEEFHPNPDFDVRSVVQFSLQSIFNTGHPFFEDHFTEEMKNKIGLSSDAEELREAIQNFQSNFHAVRLKSVEFPEVSLDLDNGKAYAKCEVEYQTQPEKGKRFKTQTAEVEFNLRRNEHMQSWWNVEQVICDLLF